MTKWINKKLSDLFEISYGSFIPKINAGTQTPFITTGTENNGISYYVDEKPMFKAPALTIASDGSVGTTFFQEQDFSASNIVVVLEPKNNTKLTKELALYLVAAIQKYASQFNWTHKYSVNRVRKTKILFPVTSTDKLDTEYIANYIHKIEADYIRKIKAYLSVLGYKSLSDCQLTNKDKEILQGHKNTKKIKINDILEYIKTITVPYPASELPKHYEKGFTRPGLTSGINNQGLTVYVPDNCQVTNLQNVITISANGANSGATFYQEQLFTIVQDSYAIQVKKNIYNNITDEINLFLTASLNKRLEEFSWNNKARWNKIKSLDIILPATSDNQIDFDFMDKYITAIEKKKVLKLKQFLDHKLDLYKQIVNK